MKLALLLARSAHLLGGALVVTASAALSACSGPGFVDEPTGYVADNSNAVKSLMESLGAVEVRDNSIDYSQRALLVMPSDDTVAALPAPMDASSAPSAMAENGSVDPETPSQEITLGKGETRGEKLLPGNSQSRLLPAKQRNTTSIQSVNRQADEANPKLNPDEMSAGFDKFKELKAATAAIQASGPRERQYLTDPPTRFTTPAETAAFELPKERRKAPKIDECKQENIDARTFTRCQYRNN